MQTTSKLLLRIISFKYIHSILTKRSNRSTSVSFKQTCKAYDNVMHDYGRVPLPVVMHFWECELDLYLTHYEPSDTINIGSMEWILDSASSSPRGLSVVSRFETSSEVLLIIFVVFK